MIVSLEGVMGSGKTLTAVALASTEYQQNGRRVISNVHLNFPYTRLDLNYFLDHLQDEELGGCVLILDEAYLYLEARNSSGKLNKLFTYFIVQTRKREVDLYFCIHHIDVVDKRLRRAIDIRGTCRYKGQDPCDRCSGTGATKLGNVMCPVCASNGEGLCKRCGGTQIVCPKCLGCGVTGWATTRFIDLRTGYRSRIRVLGPAFWDLYDTKELIPFSKKQVRIPIEDL